MKHLYLHSTVVLFLLLQRYWSLHFVCPYCQEETKQWELENCWNLTVLYVGRGTPFFVFTSTCSQCKACKSMEVSSTCNLFIFYKPCKGVLIIENSLWLLVREFSVIASKVTIPWYILMHYKWLVGYTNHTTDKPSGSNTSIGVYNGILSSAVSFKYFTSSWFYRKLDWIVNSLKIVNDKIVWQ